MRPPRGGAAPALILPLAGAGVVFLVLPLVALALKAPWGMAWELWSSPASLDSLRLSAATTIAATLLATALGVPLAFVFARLRFPGREVLRAATVLPMVLPPVVGGIGLLEAYGNRGLLGPGLGLLGWSIPFTTVAVVLAETFVAMPFLVITVEAALRTLDPRFEEAARTLGARPSRVFLRITLPLIAPAVAAGDTLAWARALGEFGATITFAGNLPGVTQTSPLAAYVLLQSNPEAALMLSVLLLAVSLGVILGLRGRWLGRP